MAEAFRLWKSNSEYCHAKTTVSNTRKSKPLTLRRPNGSFLMQTLARNFKSKHSTMSQSTLWVEQACGFSEVCEVKRPACWDMKHIFSITDYDNISKAEQSNIPFHFGVDLQAITRAVQQITVVKLECTHFKHKPLKFNLALLYFSLKKKENQLCSRGWPGHMFK